jgi:type IV secretory pathway TrbD component
MFNLYDLFCAALFAFAVWFLAHAAAAAFTTTEPGIDEIDEELRWKQAFNLLLIAALFLVAFLISLE